MRMCVLVSQVTVLYVCGKNVGYWIRFKYCLEYFENMSPAAFFRIQVMTIMLSTGEKRGNAKGGTQQFVQIHYFTVPL